MKRLLVCSAALLMATSVIAAAELESGLQVGDFATAATAVILEIDGGTCTRAVLALSNAGPAPLHAEAAAAALTGKAIDDAAIDAAAEKVIEVADPVADLHGPVAFRKQMAGEMTRRAVRAALARAGGG